MYVVSIILAILFIPIYLNRLGAESFALIGVYALIQASIFIFDIGFRQTIGREFAKMSGTESIEEARNIFTSIEFLVVFISSILLVTIFFSAEFLAVDWLSVDLLSAEFLAKNIKIIGLIVILRFIECIYIAALVGLQRQVALNFVIVVNLLLRFIGSVAVLEFISNDIITFFYWQLLVAIISIVTLMYISKSFMPQQKLRGKFSWISLSNISRYAGGVMIASILGILITQMDKIVLTSLVSLSSYTPYVLAGTLVGVLLSITMPVANTFFPQLTQAHESGDQAGFSRLFRLSSQLVACTVAPLALVFIIFPREVVYLWTGELSVAVQVAPVLQVLAVGNLLAALSKVNSQAMYATGWTSFLVYMSIFGVVMVIPMNYFLISKWGVLGAAYGWLIYNAIVFHFEYIFLFRKLMKGQLVKWLKGIYRPILASLIMILLLKWIFADFIFSNILTGLGSLTFIFLMTLFAALLATDTLKTSIISKFNSLINPNDSL